MALLSRSIDPTNPRMDRRQELIDAAAEVFYKKGYADTTLQDIANIMNFTKPAIYYYASSKEALFLEFYEQVVNGAIKSANAVLEAEHCSRTIFTMLVESHIRILLDNVQANSVFDVAQGSLSSETQNRMSDLADQYTEIFKKVYEQGVKDGLLANENSGLVVNLILGACNSAHRWYDPSGKLGASEFAHTIVRVFTLGIYPRE